MSPCRHSSRTSGHRGANGAAVADLAQVWRVAGEAAGREPRRGVADRAGRPAPAPACTDVRGCVDHLARTVRPRPAGRRTSPRAARRSVPSTERSWLIMIREIPLLADQVGEQRQDLRLHDHVQGRGGLVGDDQVGAAGQRHRDHHPLTLSAGELVRIAAPRGATGRRRCRGARPCAPRAAFSPTFSCSTIGSRIWSPIGLDRVQRAHRALEHDGRLGPADRRAADPSSPCSRSSPRKRTSPVTFAVGGSSRSRLSANVVLPEPDSPGHAERLARPPG